MNENKKHVLLIIGGGIAAYKSLLLIRLLARAGIETTCIISKGGQEFVTPLSASALSGNRVYTDLFSLSDEADMGHIELSRMADLIVVAPATADILAKAASGLAGDLATTTLLATDKKILFAPAMNIRMWENEATQKNIKTLLGRGCSFVGPGKGEMACGEYGMGRMAEPEDILSAVQKNLAGNTKTDDIPTGALRGKKIFITAGPTREPVDPVRYLSNRSSGKQGYAIATACAELGAEVRLISGPTCLNEPAGIEVIKIETAQEMLEECEKALPADVFIGVAAVSDWRVEKTAKNKIKKTKDNINNLRLVENPDILKTIANHKQRPGLVIGFAAETNKVKSHAKDKLINKNADIIIANNVSGNVMGGDENKFIIISKAGIDTWPRMTKTKASQELAKLIVKKIKGKK